MIERIASLLRLIRGSFCSEPELHHEITRRFLAVGIYPEHEKWIGEDRLDFFIDGVAIEVKMNGSLSALLRQVHRYMAHEEITGLIVITTRLKLARLPENINGKPAVVVCLAGGSL